MIGFNAVRAWVAALVLSNAVTTAVDVVALQQVMPGGIKIGLLFVLVLAAAEARVAIIPVTLVCVLTYFVSFIASPRWHRIAAAIVFAMAGAGVMAMRSPHAFSVQAVGGVTSQSVRSGADTLTSSPRLPEPQFRPGFGPNAVPVAYVGIACFIAGMFAASRRAGSAKP